MTLIPCGDERCDERRIRRAHPEGNAIIGLCVGRGETDPALRLAWSPPVEASNGGLFVSRGVGVHPSRRIQSYELIYVRQGCLELHEDGKHFEVNAGETLLLWPGRRHVAVCP
ncbi:cupin domain-containing protein [Paraburkholderia sp. CNPSo 3281]|uniref:cupin domain-containing protein n=1 Tax=Paraburkholderia sp. CNPSo 3281 TaxID=2940933 RepID=UPI0020B69397|nr:cupin domain-containing protein [Paraburkholderia sp. CNPSo 3281]MCP3716448.1 cupin domain-containing protein [Paraburkholderia sp. CNPSo 3281]